MTEAWIMTDVFDDQRKENRLSPNVPVSHEELAELGILYRKLDPATMLEPTIEEETVTVTKEIDATDGSEVEVTRRAVKKISEVDRFMRKMGYKTRDEVFCCPAKLENYEARLKSFFEEHIHEDEEIRLIRDGVGYFDIRAKDDARWIRIKVTAGDLIIVPAGCYHRFTMDESDYTHAVRLFSEVPKWTPFNRCEKETAVNAARVEYERRFLLPMGHPERLPEKTVWAGAGGGAANLTTNVIVNLPDTFDAVVRRVIKHAAERKAADNCRFFKIAEKEGGLAATLAAALEAKNSKIASKPAKLITTAAEVPYLVVLYFTGAHFPFTVSESWCPDCVASDPIVNEQLSHVYASTQRLLKGCCNNDDEKSCGGERATAEKPFVVSDAALAELISSSSASASASTSSSDLAVGEKVFGEHPFAHVSFLQCDIQRYSYLGNPAYPYRTHPFIQLQSIPTVMVLRVGLKGKNIATAVDQEADGEAAHVPVDEAETEADVAVVGRYTDPLPADWLTSILSKQFGPSAI